MTKPAIDFYEVTVSPIGSIVSVAELRDFARLDTVDTTEDLFLAELIAAATDDLERYTNRWFVERTAIGYYSGLELSQYETYPFTEIQHSPLLDVSEVATWTNGAYAAITDYTLKQRDGYARVLFPNAYNFDNIDTPYPYRITFIAGYGAVADVPSSIKIAIMMYASYLYENRGDCDCGADARQSSGAKMLMARYRISRTF